MAIVNQSSANVTITEIKPDNAKFKALNKSVSINQSLPEKFSIPEKPEFAVMFFPNLGKVEDGKPTGLETLGVAIYDANNKQKVVSINTLSRQNFSEAVAVGDTAKKQRKATIDVFQNVNMMELTPAEKVDKLKGQTFVSVGESSVWVGDKWENGQPTIYIEKSQRFYTTEKVVETTT